MARTSGYTRYVCDRCGTDAYLTDGSVQARSWYDIRRYRAGQAASGDAETRTLCADCYGGYVTRAQDEDTAFDHPNSDIRKDART